MLGAVVSTRELPDLERMVWPLKADESWKHTDLRRIFQDLLTSTSLKAPGYESGAAWPTLRERLAKLSPEASQYLLEHVDELSAKFTDLATACWHLIFVDGAPCAIWRNQEALTLEQELGEQLTINYLGASVRDAGWLAKYSGALLATTPHVFGTFNQAQPARGVCLHVAPAVAQRVNVQITYLQTQNALSSHYRLLVVLGEGSELGLCEHMLSLPSLTTFVTNVREIFLAERARLEHVKIVEGAANGHEVQLALVEQQQQSVYRDYGLLLGGKFTRNESRVRLVGKGAESLQAGIQVAPATAHLDTYLSVDHIASSCQSRQNYKSVVSQQGTSVFGGLVNVTPAAQDTVAAQFNKNLLLSSAAKAYTRPHLQISTDAVKCSHGATVADIDPEYLFYLQSRGIALEDARYYLAEAFLKEILLTLPVRGLESYCLPRLAKLLKR